MNRNLIFAIIASLLVFSSCDFFRKVAQRPTSEDIEKMRMEILSAEQTAHQARLDSLRKVEKQLADSLAIIDSIKQINGTILNPSAMGGLFASELDKTYYIIVGAFSDKRNADALISKISVKGYDSQLISFQNGFNAVALCPTNSIDSAYVSLKRLQKEKFCPPDAWILVNAK